MNSLRLAAVILVLIGFAAAAEQESPCQPNADSPIGAMNPDAPAGTSQYEFLIGDWNLEVTLFRPAKAPFTYESKWHNHWIVDGYIVMQEWRGPFATGMELRSYDAAEDIWNGRNIYYPSPGTWYENTAKFADSEMVVTTIRQNTDGSHEIMREIYYDISQSSFKIRTEISNDDGKSWQRGRYELTARRSESL